MLWQKRLRSLELSLESGRGGVTIELAGHIAMQCQGIDGSNSFSVCVVSQTVINGSTVLFLVWTWHLILLRATWTMEL